MCDQLSQYRLDRMQVSFFLVFEYIFGIHFGIYYFLSDREAIFPSNLFSISNIPIKNSSK